jgi:hypothetical protein
MHCTRKLFLVHLLLLFADHYQSPKLVRSDVIEVDPDAQLQRRPEVERAPQQQTRLGRLRRIEPVQRAVVATAAIVGSVRAEAGVTEFLAAERPVNQEAQGGSLGPLPIGQFGSPDS